VASYRLRNGYWYYRYIDEYGKQVERRGDRDRAKTELLGEAVERRIREIKAGVIDPIAEARRAAAAKPLTAHIDDWAATLPAKEMSAGHQQMTISRVKRLLLEVGVCTRIDQLTAERIQEALGRLRAAGMSAQCANHYRSAARQFSRWLHATGRIAVIPTALTVPFNVARDRRLVRRRRPHRSGDLSRGRVERGCIDWR